MKLLREQEILNAIFLDADLVLLLAADKNAKENILYSLRKNVIEGRALVTSAPVVSDIYRYFFKHYDSGSLRSFFSILSPLLESIIPEDGADLERAVDMMDIYRIDFSAARCAALLLNRKIRFYAGFDPQLQNIPGIETLDLRL